MQKDPILWSYVTLTSLSSNVTGSIVDSFIRSTLYWCLGRDSTVGFRWALWQNQVTPSKYRFVSSHHVQIRSFLRVDWWMQRCYRLRYCQENGQFTFQRRGGSPQAIYARWGTKSKFTFIVIPRFLGPAWSKWTVLLMTVKAECNHILRYGTYTHRQLVNPQELWETQNLKFNVSDRKTRHTIVYGAIMVQLWISPPR